MKSGKTALFVLVLALFAFVMTSPFFKKDEPTPTVQTTAQGESETARDSIHTEKALVKESETRAVSTAHALPITVIETEGVTIEHLPVLAPLDTAVGTVLVTGLPDTPPIALTSNTPTVAPPVLVTGLADTLPIEVPALPPVFSKGEITAAYVATAYRLDFPKSDKADAESIREEIDAIVKKAKKNGINTLFFQVRPSSDAFYRSDIFPSSRYLVKNEGDEPPLDVLAYFIKAAHREGIALHAWINPYRVRASGDSASLSPKNPAAKNPALLLTVQGGIYYHPALPEVISLITAGVAELVRGYAVDGILFDDYFYPEGITTEDAAAYEAYRQGGGEKSLGDWRRENVNRLIQSCYRAIKSIRPDCLFGVSPRGIWRNIAEDAFGSMTEGSAAYDSIYCDAMAWVRANEVDYLAPQLYFSYHDERAAFLTLSLWWQTALRDSGVLLIPSLAAYKLSPAELQSEIFYLSHLESCHGYALYRISDLPS